jgi:hypothetical protein
VEMTPVWKESKRRSPLPLFPHWLGKLAKPRASHIPTASAATGDFPFLSNSFNFNFDEKCYLHARYLLLRTSPTAQACALDGFSR